MLASHIIFGDCIPLFNRKVALPKSDLLAKLTELGQKSDQFTLASSPETDFVVERKIVDATVAGTVSADSLKKNYKAFLLLDEPAHEARYNEEMAETSKDAGVSPGGAGASEEKKVFRGKVLFSKQSGKEFVVKKEGLTPVYDYSFDVQKVRDPIKDLVENSGWKFKQVTFKRDATYKK